MSSRNEQVAGATSPRMQPDTDVESRWVWMEPALLIFGLMVFVLLNISTADKTPAVWCDEVMYQDPAVNLFQGHGFHSGAWFAQSMDKFWAGNVPLYQLVLFGWLKLFGFSLRSVRSLHYVLVSIGLFVAWLGVRRFNLIVVPAHRLFFCAVICLCNPTAFVYRCVRPESLGILLVAFAFLAFSFRPHWLSIFMLALIGALLTWSGLQLAVYLGLMCGVALFFGLRQYFAGFFSLCLGCALGGCLLYLFYNHFGVWNDFLNSIRHFTIANQHTEYAHVRAYGAGLGDKLKRIPGLYLDYSFVPMLVLALWMVFRLMSVQALSWQSPICFGIVASLVIPLGLHFLGVFPIYYLWMAFVPLTLGVFAQLESWWRLKCGRLAGVGFICLVALACFMGLPRRLVVASLEWDARSYDPVMKLAAPYVPEDRLVYTDFAGYYAAKQHSAMAMLPTYIHSLTDDEKQNVSVAIINSENASSLTNMFGGKWRDTGAFLKLKATNPVFGLRENLDSRQYNLRVFVRQN